VAKNHKYCSLEEPRIDTSRKAPSALADCSQARTILTDQRVRKTAPLEANDMIAERVLGPTVELKKPGRQNGGNQGTREMLWVIKRMEVCVVEGRGQLMESIHLVVLLRFDA
jgi:hypothetical protein